MGSVSSSTVMAEKISWYCALLMALMLVLSCCEVSETELSMVGHPRFFENKPCDEIYVVREGETLNTISEKCGDPYIVEENPHIHDPDDVFPGLYVILEDTKTWRELCIFLLPLCLDTWWCSSLSS
uniref:LysM domain-containing protein n=1 Tax=Populus davidiana TaxID=266767 RepID=A0A6M2EKB6_9ROSI